MFLASFYGENNQNVSKIGTLVLLAPAKIQEISQPL